MTNKNDSAYPIETTDASKYEFVDKGLTKRELISAMCLQGLLSNSGLRHNIEYAKDAVKLADALIAELNKGEK